jgi:hypothetical protein
MLQISKARPYFSPLALSSPPALAADVLVVPDLLLVGELVVRAGAGRNPWSFDHNGGNTFLGVTFLLGGAVEAPSLHPLQLSRVKAQNSL